MRQPKRYRIKQGCGKQPFHYVTVGGNGEPMNIGEGVSTLRDCERRVRSEWLASVRSVLPNLRTATVDEILAAHPIPWTKDSLRVNHH